MALLMAADFAIYFLKNETNSPAETMKYMVIFASNQLLLTTLLNYKICVFPFITVVSLLEVTHGSVALCPDNTVSSHRCPKVEIQLEKVSKENSIESTRAS